MFTLHQRVCALAAAALGGLLLAAPQPLVAQTGASHKELWSLDAPPPPGAALEKPEEPAWNHFHFDSWLGFNIKAKFADSGSGAAAPPSASAGSAVNRTYVDGYVHVDSSHNAGGETWNWGYQNASQISDGSVLMHATVQSPAITQSDSGPIPGFKFSYIRDVSHDEQQRWGLKFGFGYMNINLSSSSTVSANEQLITDAYPLNGVTPPLAPYSGSYNGPGPVLGSTPTRTTSISVTTISGTRTLNADLYEFQFGPTFDADFTPRFSVGFGFGFAFGLVDGTFSYDENVTDSVGTTHVIGRNSNTELQTGGYVEGGMAYKLCKAASIFVGAQFQDLGVARQNFSGHSASLDLSQSVFLITGLEVEF